MNWHPAIGWAFPNRIISDKTALPILVFLASFLTARKDISMAGYECLFLNTSSYSYRKPPDNPIPKNQSSGQRMQRFLLCILLRTPCKNEPQYSVEARFWYIHPCFLPRTKKKTSGIRSLKGKFQACPFHTIPFPHFPEWFFGLGFLPGLLTGYGTGNRLHHLFCICSLESHLLAFES